MRKGLRGIRNRKQKEIDILQCKSIKKKCIFGILWIFWIFDFFDFLGFFGIFSKKSEGVRGFFTVDNPSAAMEYLLKK